MVLLKKEKELAIMRECGRIVALSLQKMAKAIQPGITTMDLNQIGEEVIRECGASPSFKGYRGFPSGVCISVNCEVVHGIPGRRKLKEGDIVSLDVGAHLSGYHGDGAWTYPVGEISSEARDLLVVGEYALYKGIERAQVGNRVGDISHAIQEFVESHGYSVVRDLVGHGIGRSLHEEPSVPNFGRPRTGPRLRVGMTICIEPMINQGRPEVRFLDDGWTVVTRDGSLSAHFEHMVSITSKGPEVLTVL